MQQALDRHSSRYLLRAPCLTLCLCRTSSPLNASLGFVQLYLKHERAIVDSSSSLFLPRSRFPEPGILRRASVHSLVYSTAIAGSKCLGNEGLKLPRKHIRDASK